MKRRDFLKTTVAGAVTLGTPFVARAQQALPEVINVGHLVGICMSPLFFAHAAGYFKDEGLNVQLKFMPNPGDAITALVSNAMDVIHNPFTNAFVAAAQASAPIRIIAGSGAGGLFIIAQKESGIRSMADLAAAKGKGLKIGTIRFNTFELTLYRNLRAQQSRLQRLQHRLVQRHAVDGRRPSRRRPSTSSPMSSRSRPGWSISSAACALASSLDVWGPHGPDCVTNTSVRFLERHPEALRRYIKAILRADAAIKADMPKAVEVLDAAKYYRVDKATLTAALPRQMPQVDITKGGDKGMEIAINDMVTLGYLKTAPAIIDTTLLKQALG